jgi:chorismate dehydratase
VSHTRFRLGAVSYWNAIPLYHTLKNRDDIELIPRLPAQLAEGLDAGEYDAALMPVVDHLRGHGDGILGDGIVGATGKVSSVMLFSKVPIEEVKSVALDTSSHSSVALITVILREFYKLSPTFVDHGPQLHQMLETADAALLIGDPALAANRPGCPYRIYDLAGEWQKFTGLSFVFAAWIARKNLENREELIQILNEARDAGMTKIDQMVATVENREERELLKDYLINTIEHTLTDKHREGLNRFKELTEAQGLLAQP